MVVAGADQVYREVMTVDPPEAVTPLDRATRDFVFGEVWSRPGLSRRDRRWVTLACVAAADAPGPIEEHVYAALNSGDMELEAMLEYVLQFAVYCGWPKASHVEGVIRRQWARVREERGEPVTPWPVLDNVTLGPNDWEQRVARGAQEFADVNLIQAPPPDTPYTHAGILNFVFGHVWQRPGLTRRERRLVTIACVAIDDSPMPLLSHVTSALHSGDVTKPEMDELVLQFAAYYGFAKADALRATAEGAWARREQ
ncbi:MAG TPA: carboxymuconolactone decarboxylase family protein [Acidimicrobiia bacterium]|nr:carboxymuconolactone decarboxylase family protein [Acidimicrobiia bacterium]